MAIQNVALVGAGGNIGTPILSALTAAGFNVTVISRRSSKSSFPKHKVIQVSDDYPHHELVAAFKGQQAVVSTITIHNSGGFDALRQAKVFIDAAIEAGVRRFLPSEFGTDNRDAAVVALSPISADKRQVFEYLQSKQGQIEYTLVPTGPFFDFGFSQKFLGFDLGSNKALITGDGANKFSSTTEEQVGEGVAAILKHDEATANQVVPLESLLVSQNDLLAALEKEGRSFEVEHQDVQGLIDRSRAGVEAGNVYAAYGLIQAALFSPGYGADMSADAARWRQALGLRPRELQQEIKRVLALY